MGTSPSYLTRLISQHTLRAANFYTILCYALISQPVHVSNNNLYFQFHFKLQLIGTFYLKMYVIFFQLRKARLSKNVRYDSYFFVYLFSLYWNHYTFQPQHFLSNKCKIKFFFVLQLIKKNLIKVC